ncbi:PBPb domain-containing protein [Caenorhabditis elegans]|uniref:PBPb domain-containing protein n=1 Tax=Caenorhabditis elegans TaxID=6239 RepID=O01898_CAEEL|nr:PBPb domain-containing protein [Caenorhabditis elegans]CCD64974.3 PBPb domain-containing protein [Caenorhabditis elegans]
MLGDIQKGRIDMACGRFRMTADRANVLTFTYPTQFEVNQVYLITDPQKSVDVVFLFHPFSTTVWLLLSLTVLVVAIVFFILRFVEFKSTKETESSYECIQNSIFQVLLSTFNLEIRVAKKSTFFAFHLFSTIWLLAWFHVFIDFYTSELSGMMVVSDKRQVPFDNFYGFIDHLRKGNYRLFTPSADRIPECPHEITTSKCNAIFSEILSKHPPEYGDLMQLNDREFVSSRKIPLVGFGWYPAQRISSKFSIWTQELFHSDIWLIRDFPVCPAAYIVRPTFPYLDELNEMIIKVLPAFSRIDNHYTPAYPELTLTGKPSKSSFSLNQLSSIFLIHLLGAFVSTLFLIAELVIAELTKRHNIDSTLQTRLDNSKSLKMENG